MPYTATVIEVMIASPSDVAKERLIVRDVIAEWNTIHSKDRKTILAAIGWETHSVPETGDSPQAIINGQLLKDADLLIAIFWTRIGSPTGTAQSGTVEEIEEHLAAGKSAMIYFSSAPVRPENIDNAQYIAVQNFKKALKARGLYHEYEDLGDFRAKLSRQLAQKVISNFSQGETPGGTEVSAAIDVPHEPRPQTQVPRIGEESGKLLIEASRDPQGTILSIRTMSGASIQTNRVNFVERGNARSEARWLGAIAELEREGLIESRGRKGEVYFVTDFGYRVADLLQQR